MTQRARIMVGTPTYTGEVHARFCESLMQAFVYCLYHKVELELVVASRFSLVQYARNYLLHRFLTNESFTHLMWIDSDVGFDPRAIMQLLDHGKDVVGGVYPVKSIPVWFPYEPLAERSTGLHLAKSMPGGFLLCTRAALETVSRDRPTYRHQHDGKEILTRHVFEIVQDGDLLLGEDIILCRKLLERGIDIWCDPDIYFRHCGMFEWGGNLKRMIEMDEAGQLKDLPAHAGAPPEVKVAPASNVSPLSLRVAPLADAVGAALGSAA